MAPRGSRRSSHALAHAREVIGTDRALDPRHVLEPAAPAALITAIGVAHDSAAGGTVGLLATLERVGWQVSHAGATILPPLYSRLTARKSSATVIGEISPSPPPYRTAMLAMWSR